MGSVRLHPHRCPDLQGASVALADLAQLRRNYLFIAIVWANHHHLMRYAAEATPRLMWFNFAHLFSVSLLPLSTAYKPNPNTIRTQISCSQVKAHDRLNSSSSVFALSYRRTKLFWA